MKRFVSSIWNAEPVVIAGSLATGWTGLVAFDKASDGFDIPVLVYAVAAFVIPFVTGLVRRKVSPVD